MLYCVTALNPKVNSPPFAATVAAAAPQQHLPGTNPVHQLLGLSIEVEYDAYIVLSNTFCEPVALNSKLSLNLLP